MKLGMHMQLFIIFYLKKTILACETIVTMDTLDLFGGSSVDYRVV